MPTDKFNIPFLYASKPNGFFYQQSDNPKNDSNFDPPSSFTYDGGGVSTMHVSGPTDFGILKDTNFQDCIGGCNMDFSVTASRGYANKSSDPRDCE